MMGLVRIKQDLGRLLLKVLALASPLIGYVCLYLTLDPFKVIRAYDNYYAGDGHVTLNRDFVSLEMYEKNAASGDYDSFILGNSRSIFYAWKDWTTHIHSERVFHFDASSESLLGINLKLKYLDGRCRIANCLIVLDAGTLAAVTNQTASIFAKHPKLSGQSTLAFHWMFFRCFLDKRFVWAYSDLKLSQKFKASMDDVLERRVWDYDAAHNELSLKSTVEKEILEGTYYKEHRASFSARDGIVRYSAEVIGPRQMELLEEIRDVFERHRCDYRVVISPLYNQVNLAAQDRRKLLEVFGQERVFDFSGVNELTTPVENYYEESHYRPKVARAIMDEVYKAGSLSAAK